MIEKETNSEAQSLIKEDLIHVLHPWSEAALAREMYVIAAQDGNMLWKMIFLKNDTPDIRADHVGHIFRAVTAVADTCCHKQRDLINTAEIYKILKDRSAVSVPVGLSVVRSQMDDSVFGHFSGVLSFLMIASVRMDQLRILPPQASGRVPYPFSDQTETGCQGVHQYRLLQSL